MSEKKDILKSIFTIFLFFSINFGGWELLVANGMRTEWASFCVYAVLVVVVTAIWNKKIVIEWKRLKEETTSPVKFILELVVILVLSTVMGYLLLFLVSGQSQTENTSNVSEMVNTLPPILSCVMMSVFTPIIEEFTFRESMLGFINKKNKVLTVIMAIVSIIVFDCIHLYRWQDFFYYLPISIGLTLFYMRKNKNICASMLMHACANLPGAILMVLGLM